MKTLLLIIGIFALIKGIFLILCPSLAKALIEAYISFVIPKLRFFGIVAIIVGMVCLYFAL